MFLRAHVQIEVNSRSKCAFTPGLLDLERRSGHSRHVDYVVQAWKGFLDQEPKEEE